MRLQTKKIEKIQCFQGFPTSGRKKYGLKAARRAWPALRHTHLRGSADPASGAAALKWPRFFRRRRRFGHFPSSPSADLSAGLIKMPPIWAAFCLRSFRAPSQMGRRTAPAGAFRSAAAACGGSWRGDGAIPGLSINLSAEGFGGREGWCEREPSGFPFALDQITF